MLSCERSKGVKAKPGQAGLSQHLLQQQLLSTSRSSPPHPLCSGLPNTRLPAATRRRGPTEHAHNTENGSPPTHRAQARPSTKGDRITLLPSVKRAAEEEAQETAPGLTETHPTNSRTDAGLFTATKPGLRGYRPQAPSRY
ncbi:hypothetical protein AOLI_G00283640 [Acnodon oligacanthus]